MVSKIDPDYSAVIVSKDGPRYNITNLMDGVETDESDGQLARRVTVSFFNILNGTKYMNQLIRAMDRLFLYANDGDGPKEVFRGYIWEIEYSSELEKILSVTAYDNLIFFQESEDSLYFCRVWRPARSRRVSVRIGASSRTTPMRASRTRS